MTAKAIYHHRGTLPTGDDLCTKQLNRGIHFDLPPTAQYLHIPIPLIRAKFHRQLVPAANLQRIPLQNRAECGSLICRLTDLRLVRLSAVIRLPLKNEPRAIYSNHIILIWRFDYKLIKLSTRRRSSAVFLRIELISR